jgi:hypothetical protein
VIGVVQATEAVKLILGIGEPLIGRLLTYDALGMRFREVRLRRDPNCPLCGSSPTIKDLSIHRAAETAGLADRFAFDVTPLADEPPDHLLARADALLAWRPPARLGSRAPRLSDRVPAELRAGRSRRG